MLVLFTSQAKLHTACTCLKKLMISKLGLNLADLLINDLKQASNWVNLKLNSSSLVFIAAYVFLEVLLFTM